VPGAGGRTTFNRVNLVPFTLDTLAERMTVNGLGGDDKATGAAGLAGRTLLTLNGNAGVDTLTGGDGPDRISGGEANDVLDGGAGDDRITGDRGNDQMLGGPGDDELEWNNGDGSDTAIGGDGADLVRVNGSVTQGDAMEVAPNGQGIRFQRTNLVPFTIDLDTERIEMNGLGGDDTIAAKPGLAGRLGVLADGGSGDDRIEVRNGAPDSVEGGSGTDRRRRRPGRRGRRRRVGRPAPTLDRQHRRAGPDRAPGPPVRRGLPCELAGRRGVRLHRQAPAQHREGDQDRRRKGPRGPGQPQVRRRSGCDGRGPGEAARQGRLAREAREAPRARGGLIRGGRLAYRDRSQPDAQIPPRLAAGPLPEGRAPGSQ
jgi:hypothetical protein